METTLDNDPKLNIFRSYEAKFRSSVLWSYLPEIHHTQHLLPFLQAHVAPDSIVEDQSPNIAAIEAFCTHVQKRRLRFPQYYAFYVPKITSTFINEKIQFILTTLIQKKKANPKTIRDWMLPLANYEIQLQIYEAYFELMSVFTVMIMLEHGSLIFQGSLYKYLSMPYIYPWLNGQSLLFLDSLYCRLLPQLIDLSLVIRRHFEGIELYNILEQDKEFYLAWLQIIDYLLSRLSFADWVQFFDADQFDPIHPRVKMIDIALKLEHPLFRLSWLEL